MLLVLIASMNKLKLLHNFVYSLPCVFL
uniref:Uncharacterized protein n=1 Tax=Rhizophora mucronata TaxID=61149 RepID=A0A2P2QL05_RHIMU